MPTIREIQNKIISEFDHLDDWLDKYEYLIALGKNLPVFIDEWKSDETALQGCQSRVWIQSELNNDRLSFKADSDSAITKGMLALLIQVFNEQAPGDIAHANLYFIKAIGLNDNLSPSRALGLAVMVNRMKLSARQHCLQSP